MGIAEVTEELGELAPGIGTELDVGGAHAAEVIAVRMILAASQTAVTVASTTTWTANVGVWSVKERVLRSFPSVQLVTLRHVRTLLFW